MITTSQESPTESSHQMAYAFPQYDRRIFKDLWVEDNHIATAIERLHTDATEHYKTNTYVVETINIIPIEGRGGFDIYMTTRR